MNACLAGAVDHGQQVVEKQIEVGSVILSTGSRPYDSPRLDELFQYRSNPNVLTSLEFERILSASGPTMGHLIRPSDQKEPKKIAWFQCIGSRDTNQCGNGYCSSVCCMYAIKDAMMAKEHAPGGLECTIFNMDIRTFGKDYEKYYLRARDKAGVRFVKARIHSFDEINAQRDLRVRYADENGEWHEEVFRSDRPVRRAPGAAFVPGTGRAARDRPGRLRLCLETDLCAPGDLPPGRLCLRGVPGTEGHPQFGHRGQRRRLPGGGKAGGRPPYPHPAGGFARTNRRFRRGAADRRVCLQLRHQHRRSGGRGRGGGIRPGACPTWFTPARISFPAARIPWCG